MGVTNLKIRLTSTHFSGNGSRKTYLCPVLGKAHAEIHHDKCLSELQHPNGKTLPISFIGIVPYIKHNPFGGSEPLVIQMLAKKYGFLPNFVPERAYDVTKVNGTTYGMVHRVRFVIKQQKKQKTLECTPLRYRPNIQKLELAKLVLLVTDTRWLIICHGCTCMNFLLLVDYQGR